MEDIIYFLIGIAGFLATFCAPFLVFTAIVVIIVVIARVANKNKEQAWRELAARLRIDYEPGKLFKRAAISGRLRGRSLRMYTHSSGTSQSRTTYTRIDLALDNPENKFFSLGPEGLLSQIGEALGAQDITTGDLQFDQRFVVKARPPEVAKRSLYDAMLRDRLSQAHAMRVTTHGPILRHTKLGVETDVDYSLWLIELLLDLAEAIEEAMRWS
jgi:hypothetical protein